MYTLAPGLSKNAFLRAQQFVFQHTGADEDKLRNEFRILGYSARFVFFIAFVVIFIGVLLLYLLGFCCYIYWVFVVGCCKSTFYYIQNSTLFVDLILYVFRFFVFL